MAFRRIQCLSAVVVFATLAAIVTPPVQAQSPTTARQQLEAMRRDFGAAAQAIERLDEQVKAKKFDAAIATLEELLKLKQKLEKAKLPAAIARTVRSWDERITAQVKALEAAGVKLPESVAALTQPVPANRVTRPDRKSGDSRFDISGAQGIAVNGGRQLADFEADTYGPLPFPETVSGFVESEINLLLSRQNEDGSYRFLSGRKREAGGTVGILLQAALCGYSLRQHVEVAPERIEPALTRTVDYVVYMIRSGKLRNNISDASWRYVYALRFLVNEYPHIKDAKRKALVEDACLLLLNELQDMQQGTKGQKSAPVQWRSAVSPGMLVGDHPDSGRAVVKQCPENSIAYRAGLRPGDLLRSAGGVPVDTALGYYIEQMKWVSGDKITLQISRAGEERSIALQLPHSFPGVPGFTCRDDGDGRVVVSEVDSPAKLAGVQVGDRVISVDGHDISRPADIVGLKLFAAQSIDVKLDRDGRIQVIRLECMPAEAANLGITIANGVDQSTEDGLAIQKVAGDSCLKQPGVAQGDRILRINNTPVINRRHFRNFERTLWAGQKITVTYISKLDGKRKTVEAIAGARPYQHWLTGYHGLTIERAGESSVIKSVDAGSPADVAGCRAGDVLVKINNLTADDHHAIQRTLSSIFSGQKLRLSVLRQETVRNIEFVANRPTESPWISGNIEKSGGWVYYTYVRGGTAFLTSDALRVLIRGRKNLPIHIPDEMVTRPFVMLSNLRMKQPNGVVESYRYDAGGSFWGARDIRADVGRLNAAELACLMYCDTDLPCGDSMARTQQDLKAALREFMRHRGILEYAKTGGHQKFSIAPWYLPYSYMTALQAADYLAIDDQLKHEVQRAALKTYFKYSRWEHVEDLQGEGWRIGYYPKKELLRPCLLLDGLATIKHLYRPQITVQHTALKEAMSEFNATNYGKAFLLLQIAAEQNKDADEELSAEIESLRKAINDRYERRLAEIRQIHNKFPRDALRYLEETRPHFAGYPHTAELDDLLVK